ncbi:bifunctional 3,4-dihydroxy-2-butanone-4-phosphate synthase/GTP cyclohydrolase II, partial [Streptomyces sp. NPDC059744]
MTAQPTWLHPEHDGVVEDLSLDPVEQAIRDIAAGRPVVGVAEEDRGYGGGLGMAAGLGPPEFVAVRL